MSEMCKQCTKKIDMETTIHYTDVCGRRFFCTVGCMRSYLIENFTFIDEDSDINDLVLEVNPVRIKKIAEKIKDDLNGNGNE